jgi:site-specific DNA recombinase
MRNYDNEQNQAYDYRGKRGLILLRVSTEEQEKKYGFPSQLRSIREKVIEPRGIRILDEEKFIKRDTYTGMEFRERKVLTEILEMAKRREFDVLVMDVLDRLGRTGLPREIYRAELLMNGVRILTTKPEEHADDNTLMGQMIRLLHGFKSEEERNDIIRRTMNGMRERVEKDHKLLGTHSSKYGWKYADEERTKYIVDNDPIEVGGTTLKDENGETWTKAKVRRRIVEMIDNGWTIRGIAPYLTSQHLPTGRGEEWNTRLVQRYLDNRGRNIESSEPLLVYGLITVLDENGIPYSEASIAQLIYQLHDKGMDNSKIGRFLEEKHVPTGKESLWAPATVSHWVRDEFLVGRASVFMHHVVREPGEKPRIEKRPREEWFYFPDGIVPPILVTEDGKPDIALFERVQQRLEENKQAAQRNNQVAFNYLLRGGFIKCGYCGGNMTTGTTSHQRRVYRCQTALNHGKCTSEKGVGRNEIDVAIIDPKAWARAVEIIRNPLLVDEAVEARKTADPNAERRQFITEELAKIKTRRARLTARLEDEDLDDESYEDIKLRLKELADQKRGYESELRIEVDIHEQWKKAQEQLNNFHKRCREMRERIDDPNYEPDYEFKRDAIRFFGIIVWVWKASHNPRFVIESNPPSIVSNRVW